MKNNLSVIDFGKYIIFVVIPAFKVEREIGEVLTTLPGFVSRIIVVNDASPDRTAEIVAQHARRDERIILINHERNQGVGGAMITGFQRAIELNAQIVIKIDGDGQMSPEDISEIITPLIQGKADYTKGNRFSDFQALSQMPLIRRIGNLALSFMTKAATGYWNCFDPANGFLAIRREILLLLNLNKIHKAFFFETSMLSQLYLLGAYVQDVPIPARYRNEKSNLSIVKVLAEFPIMLSVVFIRRLLFKYYLYDFSIASVYLLAGLPLLLFGIFFGGYNWAYYAKLGIGAPTGTIIISMLSLMLGFQILLAAIAIDLNSVPREPISSEAPIPHL
ncbi:MAG: glycosyltransferase family 2 protein [Chloroflexota bacterium]